MLKDVRCKILLTDGKVCNRLLGRIDGVYEIKCPRCKGITTNLQKQYNPVTGDHT